MGDSFLSAELLGSKVNGVSANVDFRDLERLRGVVVRYLKRFKDENAMLLIVADLLETQTRRRLVSEKTNPDDDPWAPWSTAYALTRTASNSLLRDSDDMLKSIGSNVSGDEITLFSDDIAYAGAQNQGSRKHKIPARQFLGLSAGNVSEITAALLGYLRGTQ